ncbi:hypothetical protein D1872_323150 [compost metagenome]
MYDLVIAYHCRKIRMDSQPMEMLLRFLRSIRRNHSHDNPGLVTLLQQTQQACRQICRPLLPDFLRRH